MTVRKQDSDSVGLYIAEEASLGVLPASPHWLELEPSGFEDFGADVKTETRETLNKLRKVRAGNVTDVDAAAGFTHDAVMRGLLPLRRGFFFTDGDELAATQFLSYTDARAVAATEVTAVTNVITWSGVPTTFLPGMLVLARDFALAANNGMAKVAAVDGVNITLDKTLAAETSPPEAAMLQQCGYEFGAGEFAVSLSSGVLTATSTGLAFGVIGITAGDTIFIGGDDVSEQLETLGTGYARVVSVDDAVGAMVLTDFTGTAATDAGSGKTVRLFFGIGFRDEPTESAIVRRSYTHERTLGSDDDGVQSQYVVGAVANTCKLNIPTAGRLTETFTYQALRAQTRTGAQGPLKDVAEATVHAVPSEEFINSSTDLFVARVVAADQTNLIGYLDTLTLTIDNGVSGDKAVGVTGAFDFTVGDFKVTGSASVYFDTINALRAVQAKEDVSVQLIAAARNEGFSFAMPLVTLSSGKLQVSKGDAIKMTLEQAAAADATNITCVYNYFPYLPDAAMPV